MNEDEQSGSLADQAAAWVPPWQRVTIAAAESEAAESEAAASEALEPDGTDSGEADDEIEDERDWQQPETDSLSSTIDDAASADGTLAVAYHSAVVNESRVVAPDETPASPDDAAPEAENAALADDDAALTDDDAALANDGAAAPAGDAAAESERAGDPDDDDEDPWQQPETDSLTPADDAADGRTPIVVEAPAASDRPANLAAALEAILLVVDEPVAADVLAEVLDVSADEATAALSELAAEYTAQSRGFDLRRAAGGWRLYTRGEYASYVERFVLDGQSVRLTQAALETLAVIAYQQPVTRSRMSAIRGVNCDGVVRTLSNRGLIEECGASPDSGAFLYRTTSLFLEKLGLDALDELPPLAPFLPDDVNGFADV